MSDGEALRAHIQDILLDYALTHLTTDYVAYTYTIANELLVPNLHLVSTADPTSFTFEPSVAKTVCAIFNNAQPAQYEERWAVDKQVATYLKEVTIFTGGRQPSETCWDEETGNRLIFDDETYNSANALLKNILSSGNQASAKDSNEVLNFLRAVSPVHEHTELLDIPLFPRENNNLGSEDALRPGRISMKDIPSLLPAIPVHTDSDEDLFTQHMVVVNGPHALECPTGSPPFESTPSLGSSSSQINEVDELLLLSPPVTSYSHDLENARMGAWHFTPRFGESQLQTKPQLGGGQSLSTFLLSFQLSPAADLQPHPADPRTPPSSPHTSITASMLGQFGDLSEFNGTNAEQLPWLDLEGGNDELGGMLEVLFKEKLPTDPTRLVLEEKLDERDSLLMDETIQPLNPSDTAWTMEIGDVASSSNKSMDDFILDATERRRIYGLPEPSYDDEVEDEDENEQPPPKRLKSREISSAARSKDASTVNRVVHFEDVDENEGEDPDTLDYVDPFHDSGIHIQETELAALEQLDVLDINIFGGLADSAEGFQGPDEDGDVIPDIDPVHMADIASLDYTHWSTDGPRRLDVQPNRISEPSNERCLSLTERKSVPLPSGPREEHPNVPQECVATASVPTTSPVVDALDDDCATNSINHSLSATKIVSASRSLQQFMKLRSRHASTPEDETTSNSMETQVPVNIPSTRPYKHFNVPPELLGKFTLTLPADYVPQSASPHHYLASLDLLQKRGLAHALARQAVYLIEREFLGDVDMILDQDTAVLFVSLRTLPAQCEALTSAINKASWDFLHVLVIFETFSVSAYVKNNENVGPMADPFSPPVVKAVKKLRRDLSIAEGCDDKRTETVVQLAFPLTVEDVARMLRLYGDMAYHRDETGGLLWNDRRWLDLDEEDTDEQDLAAIDGMNVFAAAVILANMGLDAFLGTTPQERIDQFGSIIGVNRVVSQLSENMFNRVVERRLEAMQLPPSSPPATSLENSNPVTPLEGIFEDDVRVDWVPCE
ncbi:hypothetical protein EIP86_004576 [Pleurotus ostreatoroseus]|nr:hypothetical protein EIP86_004576 [Pleurotus ostreatoroseus]